MLTLLSMLGGAFVRLLPEIMAFVNKLSDHKQELLMIDKQVELKRLDMEARKQELQQLGANQAAADAATFNLAVENNDAALERAYLSARKAVNEVQAQKTGIRWVDALNFLVRPLTTYYFLGCYGITKTCLIIVSMQANDPLTAVAGCWTERDESILAGILAFWFLGRVIEKKN